MDNKFDCFIIIIIIIIIIIVITTIIFINEQVAKILLDILNL